VRYLAGPSRRGSPGRVSASKAQQLTRAPYLEFLVRKRFGDEAISTALAAQIP